MRRARRRQRALTRANLAPQECPKQDEHPEECARHDMACEEWQIEKIVRSGVGDRKGQFEVQWKWWVMTHYEARENIEPAMLEAFEAQSRAEPTARTPWVPKPRNRRQKTEPTTPSTASAAPDHTVCLTTGAPLALYEQQRFATIAANARKLASL